MELTSRALTVPRGPYGLYAELTPGTGVPLVLMHGFPDGTHLYDRLLPYLAGRRPVVRFDFLGWGRSDKPQGYPYTAANQVGDLAAVVAAVGEHYRDPTKNARGRARKESNERVACQGGRCRSAHRPPSRRDGLGCQEPAD